MSKNCLQTDDGLLIMNRGICSRVLSVEEEPSSIHNIWECENGIPVSEAPFAMTDFVVDQPDKTRLEREIFPKAIKKSRLRLWFDEETSKNTRILSTADHDFLSSRLYVENSILGTKVNFKSSRKNSLGTLFFHKKSLVDAKYTSEKKLNLVRSRHGSSTIEADEECSVSTLIASNSVEIGCLTNKKSSFSFADDGNNSPKFQVLKLPSTVLQSSDYAKDCHRPKDERLSEHETSDNDTEIVGKTFLRVIKLQTAGLPGTENSSKDCSLSSPSDLRSNSVQNIPWAFPQDTTLLESANSLSMKSVRMNDCTSSPKRKLTSDTQILRAVKRVANTIEVNINNVPQVMVQLLPHNKLLVRRMTSQNLEKTSCLKSNPVAVASNPTFQNETRQLQKRPFSLRSEFTRKSCELDRQPYAKNSYRSSDNNGGSRFISFNKAAIMENRFTSKSDYLPARNIAVSVVKPLETLFDTEKNSPEYLAESRQEDVCSDQSNLLNPSQNDSPLCLDCKTVLLDSNFLPRSDYPSDHSNLSSLNRKTLMIDCPNLLPETENRENRRLSSTLTKENGNLADFPESANEEKEITCCSRVSDLGAARIDKDGLISLKKIDEIRSLKDVELSVRKSNEQQIENVSSKTASREKKNDVADCSTVEKCDAGATLERMEEILKLREHDYSSVTRVGTFDVKSIPIVSTCQETCTGVRTSIDPILASFYCKCGYAFDKYDIYLRHAEKDECANSKKKQSAPVGSRAVSPVLEIVGPPVYGEKPFSQVDKGEGEDGTSIKDLILNATAEQTEPSVEKNQSVECLGDPLQDSDSTVTVDDAESSAVEEQRMEYISSLLQDSEFTVTANEAELSAVKEQIIECSSFRQQHSELNVIAEQAESPAVVVEKYKCCMCCMPFATLYETKRHEIMVHLVGIRVVDTVLEVNLQKYKTMMNGEVVFKCDECGFVSAFKSPFQNHLRTHGSDAPYECTRCPLTCRTKPSMAHHILRAHEKLGKFKCDICGREFLSSGYLQDHLNAHTGTRPHQCEECGLTFSSSSLLAKHTKVHVNLCRYVCSQCGHRFSHNNYLNMHIRKMHSNFYSWVCGECGKQFRLKIHFEAHQAKHRNENWLKCEVCEKTFRLKRNLLKHIDRTHSQYKEANFDPNERGP